MLRLNKFITQYFRSPLCFAGPLSECEFLIVFSFSFPIIYLQIYCSILTFKLVSYSLTSHFRGPRSWVPLEHFGVSGPGPRFHLIILGSRVSGPTYDVPDPGSHLGIQGSRSQFSGPTFLICRKKKREGRLPFYMPYWFLENNLRLRQQLSNIQTVEYNKKDIVINQSDRYFICIYL